MIDPHEADNINSMWFISEVRKLKKSAHRIKLNTDEKSSLEKNILAFMNANPIQSERIENKRRHISHAHGQTFLFSFLNRKYMFATLAVVIVLVLSGGVSYAAEGSVPGNVLYPIKQVNEEVRSALAISDEDQAKWDAERAERRLEEASTLALSGKLDPKTEVSISTQLQAHLKQTESKIQKLETEGKLQDAAELNARVKTALALHGNILTQLNLDTDASASTTVSSTIKNSGHRLGTLLKDIKIETDKSDKLRDTLEIKVRGEGEVNREAAAKAKIESAQTKIREVKKFMDDHRDDVGAETKVKATAQIALAEKSVAEAQVQFTAKNWNEAFILASKAHAEAQAAKLLLAVQHRVESTVDLGSVLKNIDLNNFGKIEIKRDDNRDEKNEEHKNENSENRKDDDDDRRSLTPEIKIKVEGSNSIKILQ